VLDILDQYDAKATFFITAQQPDYFPMIKKVYDEGHTVGLHSYTHEYDQVYASVDAYFDDLEKIGEVAKEQLGFVPCFIRFPGGASNSISKKYSAGIMTQLTQQVLDKGYQYYDWNVSSGDGGTVTADQIIAQSETDEYTKVMLLFHDTEAKESTIQALPTVMEYYKNLGYSFKAIDRESLVVHHSVNN
jgi:peptidoglycan/xylan/chitin deacetylase (PgdA/CDA1 family)